ncbi:hypothetical protein SCLCIDRAFT_836899 [Scleroderma citrinum Foug A]|uniref:Uncharacterized protein n=1 Tax=Scleroderma citrinum Foug A TaxID=1036808 RepID=A0A0C2ZL93_9AGAM|nr:hypothetical protein SCLCIDRAFT_836899 [Scleroderma citrinum Foug A]
MVAQQTILPACVALSRVSIFYFQARSTKWRQINQLESKSVFSALVWAQNLFSHSPTGNAFTHAPLMPLSILAESSIPLLRVWLWGTCTYMRSYHAELIRYLPTLFAVFSHVATK